MRPLKEILPNLKRAEDRDADVYRPPEVPVCPRCKGAGWLRLDVPLGHPSFGLLFKCECTQRAEDRAHTNELRKLSQLDGLENKSFATFDAATPELQSALDAVRKYAQTPNGWLVLVGPCGTGKTHLAAAVANDALAQGNMSVMFAVVPDLLDHLRATFDPTRGIDYDARFNPQHIPARTRRPWHGKRDSLGARKALSDHQSSLQRAVANGHNEQSARRCDR
jgi:hypothetical protein